MRSKPFFHGKMESLPEKYDEHCRGICFVEIWKGGYFNPYF